MSVTIFSRRLMFAVVAVLAPVPSWAGQLQTIFVIAMENHNWTQPDNQYTGGQQQIYNNPNTPFINSLVSGTASATINGVATNISSQVSYSNSYHAVLAAPDGSGPSIHPSEPNYIWAEAGTNFGVANDNDPYRVPGGTTQTTTDHLSSYLTQAGRTWRSYQEDTDLARNAAGQLTNTPLPRDQWTVPLTSASGTLAPGSVNSYNGAGQYDYAAKHNPQVFFSDTNGGNDVTPGNKLARNYAPLQQLEMDLKNGTVANYNWITPNQFNAARIRQGDDFLSQIVPLIMSSAAYQNDGAIVLWWDETEADGAPGDRANAYDHTIPEIILSPDAHPNLSGLPYASSVNLTHSSDLRTWQELFGAGPFLGDAANANDLSDLFAPGAIPGATTAAPEAGTNWTIGLGLLLIAGGIVHRKRGRIRSRD